MGRPFQLGKNVKKVTKEVIKIRFIKIESLIFFISIVWEKIIDMIVKSKYQKTPCPIWGDPEKEIFGFLLNKLATSPKIAIKKGININGCFSCSKLNLLKYNKIEK